SGHADDQQRGRDRREQGREGEAIRQQPAGGGAIDIEDGPDASDLRNVEEAPQQGKQPGLPAGRQLPRSSNRTGWMSSIRTRLRGATRPPHAPRPANRRPPSLMLWRRPARAHPPIVEGVNWTFA